MIWVPIGIYQDCRQSQIDLSVSSSIICPQWSCIALIEVVLLPSVIRDLLLQMGMGHKSWVLMVLLAVCVMAAIDKDLMSYVPGYDESFKEKAYAGYLNTSSNDRKLHYVFITSSNNSTQPVPITLWLNGGPGCSSLLGFLQQIGPFYLDEGIRYKAGDNLTKNPYSWHKLSHLLFIESPAGVGYSINNDPNFEYSDHSTANDNMAALLNFFAGFPELSDNPFWIAGESYAGKYIPDLALLIDYYNNGGQGKRVNLKGILVGNGVMSFENGELDRSSVDYMVDHEFIDPDLMPYYRGSCLLDAESAGCRYFKTRYNENVDEINPYNVYSYCFYNDSFAADAELPSQKKFTQNQASILRNIVRNKGKYSEEAGKNGAPCAYFDGLYDYFNAHVKEYKATAGMTWNGPCADNITGKYYITLAGSLPEYRYLLNKLNNYQIVLYSGDWDDVVPYTDTLKNIDNLNLKESSIYTPFFANDQHAGWTQLYGGVLFAVIKGASHQVPQSKRPEAYELFKMTIETHGRPASADL